MMKCISRPFEGSGKIFTAVLMLFFIIAASVLIGYSQPALAQGDEVDDYRSTGNGYWDAAETWEVYNGTDWVPATYFPGEQPGDYTVTIMNGDIIRNRNDGELYFGDLLVDGQLYLENDLTLNTTDYLRIDGIGYDGSNILTGAAISWFGKYTLSLPVNATLDVRNIKDEYGQVIDGLGLCAPHAANNNMRIRIGAVDYAAATGGGNVVYTFDMINEAGGALAAIATAAPDDFQYSGGVSHDITLTGEAAGLGSDPAEAMLEWVWTGAGPGSFTFNSDTQNPPLVNLPDIAGTYTFTLTVTSTYAGFTYSTSDDAVVTVNPASLTITGITGVNKVYDGTTAAEVDSSSAALVGVIPGDDVAVDASGATATFGDKNVGSGKTVTVMGLTLTGADAGNYTVIQPTTTADITPRELTVTGITGVNKIYDGTTDAGVDSSGAVLDGVITGDDVAVDASGATSTFGDKNVGSGKTVTVTGLTLTGADAGDYTVIQPTTTADITPRELTVTGITGVNKIYDGTTVAEVDSTGAALDGVITGDDVAVDASGATATFGDKNVGSGKTVTVTGLSLTGADVGNYTVIQPTTTADITPRELTVTGITGVNKIYDGTTAAEVDSSGAVLGGVIPPDDVAVDASGATATFGDKNVGSGKTVTVTGLSLTGADVGNYTLMPPMTISDITPRELTVTANSCSKTYGDTVNFAGNEFEVTGLMNADTVISVTLTSDGAMGSATVDGSPYAIVPSAATGTGLENYTISYVNGNLTVNKAIGVCTLSSSASTFSYGCLVTFTANVTNAGATGTVTFKDGDAILGNSTLGNGTASYSTSDLSIARHSVTAVYNGNADFAGSTSLPIDVTVNKGINWLIGLIILALVVMGLVVFFLWRRKRRVALPAS